MKKKESTMSTTPPGQDPNPPKKNPLADKLDSLRKNEKIEGIYNYAANNTRDTLAYILMIIGIVLLFSYSFYGGFIVGLIFGLYFSDEITHTLRSLNDMIEFHGMVRSLIFGGLLLALLILAWPLYMGAAVAVGIKHILYPEDHDTHK